MRGMVEVTDPNDLKAIPYVTAELRGIESIVLIVPPNNKH